MSRKNESNQKAALRGAFGQFLRENDVTIKNSDDVNSIMKDMISLVLEGAKFWLSIMNGLKNRGVRDIFIACVDGLTGFPQAIEAVFPETEIQQCIIHQIRNSTKYVSYKDIKALMADLKLVYQAPTEEVRRLVYTTNTVEGFNRQLRKVTKSSTVFPTDDSLLKLLYLATEDITKKWTGRRQDWSRIRAQLDIYFEERLA